MFNTINKIMKSAVNVTDKTTTAFSKAVAKEFYSLSKFVEKKAEEAGHRIGLNHFQDYLFLKVKARNEEISTTWLGNPDIIESMLEGKSRSEREVIYRKLYRNNLVKFDNEESKLSFCGVYDVCDIWLETVR